MKATLALRGPRSAEKLQMDQRKCRVRHLPEEDFCLQMVVKAVAL